MANETPPTQVVVPGAGWVDVASRAITQVGFPVVIAGVLLWFLLTRFQDNMNAITGRMAANTQIVANLIEHEEKSYDELKRQSESMMQQTQLLGRIAADSQALMANRKEELDLLKERLSPPIQ